MRQLIGLVAAGAVAAGVAVLILLTRSEPTPAEAAILLTPDDPDIVLLGELLYAEHCASCHGKALEGQPNWKVRKPDGRLPAPPHDVSGHTWHHPDEQLFMLTKYGPARLVGDGYESDMPGYEGILTDSQIIAVLSYIKSTWPEDIQARHTEMSR